MNETLIFVIICILSFFLVYFIHRQVEKYWGGTMREGYTEINGLKFMEENDNLINIGDFIATYQPNDNSEYGILRIGFDYTSAYLIKDYKFDNEYQGYVWTLTVYDGSETYDGYCKSQEGCETSPLFSIPSKFRSTVDQNCTFGIREKGTPATSTTTAISTTAISTTAAAVPILTGTPEYPIYQSGAMKRDQIMWYKSNGQGQLARYIGDGVGVDDSGMPFKKVMLSNCDPISVSGTNDANGTLSTIPTNTVTQTDINNFIDEMKYCDHPTTPASTTTFRTTTAATTAAAFSTATAPIGTPNPSSYPIYTGGAMELYKIVFDTSVVDNTGGITGGSLAYTFDYDYTQSTSDDVHFFKVRYKDCSEDSVDPRFLKKVSDYSIPTSYIDNFRYILYYKEITNTCPSTAYTEIISIHNEEAKKSADAAKASAIDASNSYGTAIYNQQTYAIDASNSAAAVEGYAITAEGYANAAKISETNTKNIYQMIAATTATTAPINTTFTTSLTAAVDAANAARTAAVDARTKANSIETLVSRARTASYTAAQDQDLAEQKYQATVNATGFVNKQKYAFDASNAAVAAANAATSAATAASAILAAKNDAATYASNAKTYKDNAAIAASTVFDAEEKAINDAIKVADTAFVDETDKKNTAATAESDAANAKNMALAAKNNADSYRNTAKQKAIEAQDAHRNNKSADALTAARAAIAAAQSAADYATNAKNAAKSADDYATNAKNAYDTALIDAAKVSNVKNAISTARTATVRTVAVRTTDRAYDQATAQATAAYNSKENAKNYAADAKTYAADAKTYADNVEIFLYDKVATTVNVNGTTFLNGDFYFHGIFTNSNPEPIVFVAVNTFLATLLVVGGGGTGGRPNGGGGGAYFHKTNFEFVEGTTYYYYYIGGAGSIFTDKSTFLIECDSGYDQVGGAIGSQTFPAEMTTYMSAGVNGSNGDNDAEDSAPGSNASSYPPLSNTIIIDRNIYRIGGGGGGSRKYNCNFPGEYDNDILLKNVSRDGINYNNDFPRQVWSHTGRHEELSNWLKTDVYSYGNGGGSAGANDGAFKNNQNGVNRGGSMGALIIYCDPNDATINPSIITSDTSGNTPNPSATARYTTRPTIPLITNNATIRPGITKIPGPVYPTSKYTESNVSNKVTPRPSITSLPISNYSNIGTIGPKMTLRPTDEATSTFISTRSPMPTVTYGNEKYAYGFLTESFVPMNNSFGSPIIEGLTSAPANTSKQPTPTSTSFWSREYAALQKYYYSISGEIANFSQFMNNLDVSFGLYFNASGGTYYSDNSNTFWTDIGLYDSNSILGKLGIGGPLGTKKPTVPLMHFPNITMPIIPPQKPIATLPNIPGITLPNIGTIFTPNSLAANATPVPLRTLSTNEFYILPLPSPHSSKINSNNSSVTGINAGNITGYTPNGTYTFTSSSSASLNTLAHKAFDGNFSTYWQSDYLGNTDTTLTKSYMSYGKNAYNTSTYISNIGPYVGGGGTSAYWATNVNGVDLPGEWLQFQMPYSAYVYQYSIYTPISASSPFLFTFLGSLDGGTTWNYIDQQNNAISLMDNTNQVKVMTFNVVTVEKYSCFRLVITEIMGSNGYVQICGMNIIGGTKMKNPTTPETFRNITPLHNVTNNTETIEPFVSLSRSMDIYKTKKSDNLGYSFTKETDYFEEDDKIIAYKNLEIENPDNTVIYLSLTLGILTMSLYVLYLHD